MNGPRIGSLCTGYGGLDMAVQQVFGGSLAWVADNDPGAARILAHRHPRVPNLGDITDVCWEGLAPVDIVCGGYPCQPFSLAGELKGTADERHLWPFIARALGVLRPRVAIFENVANHLRIGFDTVLCDLAELGFDAEWCLVRASEVGAPHPRKRLFLFATAANAPDLGHERGRPARGRGHGSSDHRVSAADAECLVPRDDSELPAGRDALRHRVRDDAPRCGTVVAPDSHGERRGTGEHGVREGQPDAAWGRFLPAIRRWEHVLGRPAPRATDDQSRLSPLFVEWMMGLPAGHVTDVPGTTRTQQLKALGNGVVPQQATHALRALTGRRDGAGRRAA
ncbi:DNA cytosine methyltransferase [Streptomyces sp. RLA2-12]|nr:DNA cytosine methyltransferase [Streptomyces sp. RLA2-12]QDN60079.1 DNA cytosine methyltransferase [Streptomyces sp. S1D4-20]QDN70159.1 DNA cytosine methyltransferase [Streptomyces sp. S1D4-14]QDO52612.1 DNA cytosine methyltransferase [Streptomyces sp. RLB3-5]QDO62855.1 DNA cytosine methyltransferase [Streptomyces sp. RLB1-8]